MISSTSREAYASIKPELGEKQRAVYEAVKYLKEATNDEIAEYLDWPINRVTGRVTELHRMSMVTIQRVGLSKAGRPAKIWAAKDLNDDKLKEIGRPAYHAVSWLNECEG